MKKNKKKQPSARRQDPFSGRQTGAKTPAGLRERLQELLPASLRRQAASAADWAQRPLMDAAGSFGGVVFHSDYWESDGRFSCMLTPVWQLGSDRSLPAFWGVNLIPDYDWTAQEQFRGQDVDFVLFEQVATMNQAWVQSHNLTAEQVASLNEREQAANGGREAKSRMAASQEDLDRINADLSAGASYHAVNFRILLRAESLARLEEAVRQTEAHFKERFDRLRFLPFDGEQRREIASVFMSPSVRPGRPMYFTSDELAGSYNLVTGGLDDPGGVYVGRMSGDLNTSAVLFDANRFRRHAVVCQTSRVLNPDGVKIPQADLWAVKIGQSVLLDGGRCVHLILNQTDFDAVSPPLASATVRVDLNQGSVNLFEMFGDAEDELEIYAACRRKLSLISETVAPPDASSAAAWQAVLSENLEAFYIDQGMWQKNAKENRDRLRAVGVPHESVPTLSLFVTYLSQANEALMHSRKNDPAKNAALYALIGGYRELLEANGDIFDCRTDPAMDLTRTRPRCVYDFRALASRGEHIVRAQLINIIGYAAGSLGEGGCLIIHGADQIRGEKLQSYLKSQLEMLHRRGGRSVFVYNSNREMLDAHRFADLAGADYTILGAMKPSEIAAYEEILSQKMAPELVTALTAPNTDLTCIRRGADNITFAADLRVWP